LVYDNSVKSIPDLKEILEVDPWFAWSTNSSILNQIMTWRGRNYYEHGEMQAEKFITNVLKR